MSDTEKRPYAQVYIVATHLMAALRPACHRIEIAGSLRRKKPLVGDIEFVAVPRLHTNLIGDAMDSSEVDDLLARWPVTLHKNGSKYKAFSFEWQPGWTFKVDLFLQPDPATWGYNMLVRTGSADFSHRFVTARSLGGYKPDALTIKDARIWRGGAALPTPEEQDVFALFGVPWVQPEARS